jgi:hypothetical protein
VPFPKIANVILLRVFTMLKPLLLPAGLVVLGMFSGTPSLAQSPDLTKRLAAEGPEIERLISEMKFQEALAKAEALLPATLEPYDGSSTAAAFKSAIGYYNYAQAHYLAFKAADAYGQWEKALAYVKKTQELARTNKTETEKALSEPMKAWESLRDSGKKVLEANAARIAELKAKKEPTNADLNELDDYLSAEKNYQVGAESAKALLFAWDRGTKYVKSYDPYVEYAQQKLDEQEKEIAAYAPAKGDKTKWAEAIAQAPSYLNTYPEGRERVAFIHRLMVLAPESSKVKRALDIALGKSVSPEPKAKAKPTKKK